MINAERLRNSYVADTGAIDKFGTVRIVYHVQPGRRRKDYDVRVYSPLLHRYADGKHRAYLEGATLQIQDQCGRVVVTLTHRQLEPTGTEAVGRVTRKGFVIDPRTEHDRDCQELDLGTDDSAPAGFVRTPWARVDPALHRQTVVVFWIEDDYAVAFTPDGTAIPAVVEYRLSAQRWAN